ncbi:MAG TPA: carboxypeptidase-like regulatory domain-containing protein, partial [Vicinamibacterales bacterium]|nr:carboxypeptidase-like regulatory domain-containing protein [Vicinamibacterales bacterium]
MRTHLSILTVVVAVVASAAAGAQGRGMGQVPGGRGQRPPRDAVRPAERTGTASISGRVSSADTNRPLKRARVVLSAPGAGRPRAVTTDDAGRFQAA